MESVPVVIDAGSSFVRAGFAGEKDCKVVFPNMVGRPRCKPSVYSCGKAEDPYVGEDAFWKRGVLAIKYPIEHGFVTHMDDMDRVLRFALQEIRVCQQEHPLLLSQAPFNPKCIQEKLTEIVFEGIGIPAFSLQTSAVQALNSIGRSTGVAIELGGGVFNCSVVIGGKFSKEASLTLPISGRHITQFFKTDLENSHNVTEEQKEDLSRRSFWECLNNIKETYCFVTQNFDSDIQNLVAHEQQCELPDGTLMALGMERFRCAESIFNPCLFEVEMQGIHHQAYNAAMRAPNEHLKTLLSNVLVCGGSSLFPGLSTRLETELKHLNVTEHEINLMAPEKREYSVWRGGAKMAIDNTDFQNIWISKSDYDEYGPARIHGLTS